MTLLLFISILFYSMGVTYSLLHVVKAILKRNYSGYVLIISIMFVFYVLPGIMDFIFQVPFESYWLATKAFHDYNTNILYYNYFGIIFFLFGRQVRKSKQIKDNSLTIIQTTLLKSINKYRLIFIFLLLLPIILIFFSGNIDYYLGYFDRLNDNRPKLHSIIGKVQYLTLISGATLITYYILKKRNKQYLLNIFFVLFFIFITFWINGKRSIVVKYMVIQIGLLIVTKAISPKAIFRYGLFSALTIVSLISFYGKNIRNTFEATYNSIRIDFSRDYEIKFAFYNVLFNNQEILPYKGATYLFNLGFWIPRDFWIDKPMPYAVYFTDSVFGNFEVGHYYGWTLTTSFLGEAVANFGWFGLVLFPFFYVYLLKKEEQIENPYVQLLVYFVLIILLVNQPITVMPLILILIYLLFIHRKLTFKRNYLIK